MRIQHNIMAMNAYRNYNNNVSAMRKNLEKLSSGYKINRAGDDAAGLAISEKMRAQITGLETAQKNAKDGISLVQTAEGALTEVHDMLNRMVTLATQSANGTYDNEVDRVQLQKELDQLRTEIDRIADSANFNGIKLFDGSLSTANLTVDGIDSSYVDMAKGVEIEQGTNGGGTYGEYSINITNAFGDGDTIDITFAGKASSAGTAGKVTLTYGTDFEGETLEKQAQSLANKLSSTPNVGTNFNIKVTGTTITLTSLKEGNEMNAPAAGEEDRQVATVSAVKVNNATAVKDSTWKRTDGVAQTADGVAAFAKLFDGNTGTSKDIPNGSSMKFEVTLDTGEKMSVTLTEGIDFEKGKTVDDTINNIVNFLNNKATFDDNPDTKALDESLVKVSDLFTVSNDNAGGLEFANQTSAVAVTGIKFTGADNAAVTSTSKTAVNNANGVKDSFALELKADDGTGDAEAQNLSLGDKLTIKGELADGRKFEFDVIAGEDFDIDDTNFKGATSTLKNLEDLLTSKGIDIEILDKNGKSTGETISSTEIFGTASDTDKEIKIDSANGKFESVRVGDKFVSKITDVELTTAEDTSVSANLNNGMQQTSANSTITFNEGVEYGATVEVDGVNYELVKNASDITSGKNVAVVVKDISDTSAIARAMASAIKDKVNDDIYEVSSSGNQVTVATKEIGSKATAVSISSTGDKTRQLEFTLDPSRMKSGSSVTINGKKYEFVQKGESTNDVNAAKIEVDNFDKATSISLANALSAAANGLNNASVLADENGKVTVRGLLDSETNKIVDPTVKFADGKGGLTLQIGDTADDYNKMKVSIYKMHVTDMGIGDISILDQDSAGAAIDKIRDAINYVSDVRGTLGATQNRLDHTINNLSVMQENIQDAESTIRDTDVASEMMAYTKNNILIQSAQAMLAQANQVPQGVLQLLQ